MLTIKDNNYLAFDLLNSYDMEKDYPNGLTPIDEILPSILFVAVSENRPKLVEKLLSTGHPKQQEIQEVINYLVNNEEIKGSSYCANKFRWEILNYKIANLFGIKGPFSNKLQNFNHITWHVPHYAHIQPDDFKDLWTFFERMGKLDNKGYRQPSPAEQPIKFNLDTDTLSDKSKTAFKNFLGYAAHLEKYEDHWVTNLSKRSRIVFPALGN